ncbi:hypothetical protein, partial [Microcystis sp. LE19-195.1E]|uniref:hypothetical protein n=1 Tax=Microcystis sp. LE19-195.1E TaxID=3016440 RepID=UPI0025841309
MIYRDFLTSQDSGFRSRSSVVRRLFLFILPTPHTPHPTPHTPHPTPHTPHPTPHTPHPTPHTPHPTPHTP